MVLTAPKDIQEVEMILAAESHGEHGELNMILIDGAEGMMSKVIMRQLKVLLLLPLMALIMSKRYMEMLMHLIARLLVMM
jgi:hypothetical protein